MRTVRDEQLGAALRELGAPDHRPGFHAELHRRLAEERDARRAVLRRQRLARRRGLRWGVRVAFAAGLASAVWLVLGTLQGERGPQLVGPVLASSVQEKVRTALAGAGALSGELVVEGRSYENAYGWDEPVRWRFALTARGDFRLTGITLPDDTAYDAAKGVERSLNHSASAGGDTLFAAERRGIAPGPPDPGPAASILQDDFGAFVRALLAADDPAVRETTYEGRPAWRVEVPAAVNGIVPQLSGDRFSVWVDRETGVPVRIVESKGERALDELRIENLEVDPSLPADAFSLGFPAGAEVMRSDDGFRRVALGEVEAAVGYAPLVPGRLPSGFGLAEVAVAPGSGSPTGPEAGNPPSTDVVSLSYRRGLDQVVVTTRLRRVEGFPDIWDDPLATGEGYRDDPETIRLRRGTLSGVEARLLIVPRNIPHVWALTDDLVVTVAGDLSRAELIRAAESLRTAPA